MVCCRSNSNMCHYLDMESASTQQKVNNLFWADDNRIEQCWQQNAYVVQCYFHQPWAGAFINPEQVVSLTQKQMDSSRNSSVQHAPQILCRILGRINGLTVSSTFVLVRKCNSPPRTCIVNRVMRHARGHKPQSFLIVILFISYSMVKLCWLHR